MDKVDISIWDFKSRGGYYKREEIGGRQSSGVANIRYFILGKIKRGCRIWFCYFAGKGVEDFGRIFIEIRKPALMAGYFVREGVA